MFSIRQSKYLLTSLSASPIGFLLCSKLSEAEPISDVNKTHSKNGTINIRSMQLSNQHIHNQGLISHDPLKKYNGVLLQLVSSEKTSSEMPSEQQQQQQSEKQEPEPEPEPQLNNADDVDEDWESKRNSCGFCRLFLDSPCKEQFKEWHRCIHRAKKNDQDFVEVCRDVSSHLFACSKEHEEIFQVLSQNDSTTTSSTTTTESDKTENKVVTSSTEVVIDDVEKETVPDTTMKVASESDSDDNGNTTSISAADDGDIDEIPCLSSIIDRENLFPKKRFGDDDDNF